MVAAIDEEAVQERSETQLFCKFRKKLQEKTSDGYRL